MYGIRREDFGTLRLQKYRNKKVLAETIVL